MVLSHSWRMSICKISQPNMSILLMYMTTIIRLCVFNWLTKVPIVVPRQNFYSWTTPQEFGRDDFTQCVIPKPGLISFTTWTLCDVLCVSHLSHQYIGHLGCQTSRWQSSIWGRQWCLSSKLLKGVKYKFVHIHNIHMIN